MLLLDFITSWDFNIAVIKTISWDFDIAAVINIVS